MSDLWELVREAVATKVGTSAGVRAAGLRSCDTRTDEPLNSPCGKVLPPFLEGVIERVNAHREGYLLHVPVEVAAPRPAGTSRSSPVVSAIVRAIQVEWRSGITLGLSASGVDESWIGEVAPGLSEYEDSGQDGARIDILVRVSEVFNPARSS